MRSRLVAVLLVPLAVTGVSACKSAPHAGAAAVVGSDRIDFNELRTLVDAGYAGPVTQTPKVDYQRQVLSRMVDRKLDDAVARDLSLSVTDAQVNEVIGQAAAQQGGMAALTARLASQGVGAVELQALARDSVLRQAMATKLLALAPPTETVLQQAFQQNLGRFQTSHVAHILVKDQALADSIAAQVKADPTKFAALAKQYSIDTSNKDTGGDLGTQPRGTFVPEFEDAVFAAKAGQIIGPVKSQFGFHIIKIIELKLVSYADAKAELLQQLENPSGPYATTLVSSRVSLAGGKIGVHISTRIGLWDGKTAQVTAPDANPSTANSVPAAPASPSAAPELSPQG